MDNTNAERQRRYMARLKARAEGVSNAQDEVASLKEQLAEAKAALKELKAKGVSNATDDAWRRKDTTDRLREQVANLKIENAKLRAQKAPLPPDEARDRQIKGLKTANQNLRARLHIMEQHYEERIAQAGGMPRHTCIAIDKILHPDTRDNATEKDKDEACRGWNAWKDSGRRAEDRKRR